MRYFEKRKMENDRNRFYLKMLLLLEICQPMSGKASAIDTNEPILNQIE